MPLCLHADYGAVPAACALNGSRFMGREILVATSTPLNKEAGGAPVGAQALPDWRMELDGLPGSEFNNGQQQQHQRQQHGGHRGRGGRGGRHHEQRQRHPEPIPGKPVEGCWFCLSSDQVRRRISVIMYVCAIRVEAGANNMPWVPVSGLEGILPTKVDIRGQEQRFVSPAREHQDVGCVPTAACTCRLCLV